jgi:glycosyltransferase involved in cell wall biosynthesis/thiamine kinase-like enzyme
MKILMSALACAPGKGSELEVGYRAMLAAARRHEVWVLTNSDTIPAVKTALANAEVARRIHLQGIEFGLDEEAFARLTTAGFHWYYDRWQRRAAVQALELERQIDFDVVHHVTLASYWTRAGAAIVEKPLVLGPVGGGVETPWRLTPELGLRGLREDVGRLMIRGPIGRFGPGSRAQRKAGVILAQNKATAGRLRNRGEVVILSNATVIDLDHVRPSSPRNKDIYLVGRLIPWKAPILAVRAMRYVKDPDCMLRICGNGPERRRLERAARRWGVRDRVSFDGWLSRDVLLERLASAGALIHPALHEEAGLCVAEALAMGTPVVCLDRGGPPAILAEWPDTWSVAVKPADAPFTARAMAAAVDDFLAHPPKVRQSPLQPRSSFQQELLHAYDSAAGRLPVPRHRLRPVVWAFPRGKPQVFANTPTEVGNGIAMYAFGRRVPTATQVVAATQMSIPGLRSLIAERHDRPDPVCGWKPWDGILEHVGRTTQRTPAQWLYFRSQWEKQRSSALALDASGMPLFLVVVEPRGTASVHPAFPVRSFRVPICLDSFTYDDWHIRLIEPLPKYHRAAGWDPFRIRRVVEDIPRALDGVLPRLEGTPSHWAPVHGDFVPWNLRENGYGGLWLVDWEDAGWGPPLADAVRYIVAHRSLRGTPSLVTARIVRQSFNEDLVDLEEVANFWLQQRNFRPGRGRQVLSRQKVRDAARGAREINALRILARVDPEPRT